MNLTRFGYSLLVCATVQSVSGTSWAQVAPNTTTPTAKPLGEAAAGASSAVSGAKPAEESTPLGSQSAEPESRPRIIRGNDQVIAPARPVATPSGAPLTFSFEDAPVADVVRTVLGDIMGVPYVLHPPIAGTVTLASRNAISPDQAVFLLESALQANGLAMARDARGTYHVGRADALRNAGSDVRQARPGTPLSPGFGAIVIPLQYIGAGEMAAILRPMVAPDAILRVDTVRNLLVMNGTRTQAEGWLEMVNTFDVDLLKGMSVGVFPLKYATVAEVESALQLVGGGGGAASGAGAAAARPGASAIAGAQTAQQGAGGSMAMLGEGNPLYGALRVMPIARINSILVVTPRAEYLEQARRWIEKLDLPSNGGSGAQLFIYRVQNGNATHLASVLNGIFGGVAAQPAANSGVAPGLNSNYGSTGGSLGNSQNVNAFGNNSLNRQSSFGSAGRTGATGSSMGQFGSAFGNTASSGANNQGQVAPTVAAIGNVRVMADELNNTLLVWGSRDEFSKIESTLKRLDLPPTQVLIEASIVEVTLNDSLNFGVEWALSGATGKYDGVGQLSSSDKTNTGNTGSLNVAAGSGFTYALTNSVGKVRVVLKALAEKTAVKMISSPSLMVLDNHTAMMSVGNQVPVVTTTFNNPDVNSNTASTVQYKDTGVNLSVTPSVNAGNLVTMQIDQTVTDTTDGATSASQPVFMQRQISSKVAVRSGETIVLGGLIKDSQTSGKSGVPLLQDIPLLGNLFGTNKRGGDRTELLVIITPRVVRTDPEIREVSEDLRERLKGLKVLELRQSGPADARVLPAQPSVAPGMYSPQ